MFATSGSNIIHAGAVGAGIALKLCNNLMTYAAFAAMSEAHALAKAGGLDPALLIEVGRGQRRGHAADGGLHRQPARSCWQLGQEAAHTSSPFAALAKKDLEAALASAQALGLQLPMGRAPASA